MTPGLLVSAPASGAGKTTLTLGLARAFRDRGNIITDEDRFEQRGNALASGMTALRIDQAALSRRAAA